MDLFIYFYALFTSKEKLPMCKSHPLYTASPMHVDKRLMVLSLEEKQEVRDDGMRESRKDEWILNAPHLLRTEESVRV